MFSLSSNILQMIFASEVIQKIVRFFFCVITQLHWDFTFQVNNGDVDLDRSREDGDPVCYTAVNPFHIQLLNHEKKQEQTQFQLSKKRIKSPSRKGSSKARRERSPTINPSPVSSQQNFKLSMKLGKVGGVRCTPEGKRRRRSRFVEQVDLHSSG